MLPTVVGAGGSTVTANDCSALPPEFVAVTVTVALPAATAVTVTAVTVTAARPPPPRRRRLSEDSAPYVTPSPSKYSEATTGASRPR